MRNEFRGQPQEQEVPVMFPDLSGGLGMDVVPYTDNSSVESRFEDNKALDGVSELEEDNEIAVPEDGKEFATTIIAAEHSHINVISQSPEVNAQIAHDIIEARHNAAEPKPIKDGEEKREVRTTVLALDFSIKGSELPELINNNESPDYASVEVNILDPSGILQHVSKEEQAKIFANTVTSGVETATDIDRYFIRGLYDKVAGSLEKALKREPTLPEIRDGFRILNHGRVTEEFNEAPTLSNKAYEGDPEGLERVKNARTELRESTTKADLEAQRSTVVLLDKYFSSLTIKHDESNDIQYPNPEDGLLMVSVGVEGHGQDLDRQRDLLSHSSISLVASEIPWGNPEVVVVNGAQHMNPKILGELAEHCDAQDISLIPLYDKLPVDPSSLDGDVFAISAAKPQTNKALSELLGSKFEQQIKGGSQSASANKSVETNNWSVNVDDKTGNIKGGSVSGSSGPSEGVSWSFSLNSEWGEFPIVTPSALGEIAFTEVVIMEPGCEPEGLFDLTSGEKVAEFPPVREPDLNPLNLRGLIDDIQERAFTTQAKHLAPNDVKAAVMSGVDDGKYPSQRRAELIRDYGKRTKKSATGAIGSGLTETFLLDVAADWDERRVANKTDEGFDTWAESRGLKPEEIMRAKFVASRHIQRTTGREIDNRYFN